MLMRNGSPSHRDRHRERRLWHNHSLHSPSLGCHGCPEKVICGALAIRRHVFSCLDFCCGKPVGCDVVCRLHPDFALRVREVGGFELDTVPRAAPLEVPALPLLIPMVFHRASRTKDFAPPMAALSLYQLFHRRSGRVRFNSRDAMLEAFGLARNTQVVLSGTDSDPSIEGWWQLSDGRRAVIRQLRALGIALASTPNYSLFIDQPRWDDLHAMKRIALVHEEFLSEGLPAALHVNARTETDIYRWTDYIVKRPEVTHIAYEFTTGTGWADRQKVHATWLKGLALDVGRPLYLIVRGGFDVLPTLGSVFTCVSVIETSIFMRTMKRRRAIITDSVDLHWEPALTPVGALLDDLLIQNYRTVENWLSATMGPTTFGRRTAIG